MHTELVSVDASVSPQIKGSNALVGLREINPSFERRVRMLS